MNVVDAADVELDGDEVVALDSNRVEDLVKEYFSKMEAVSYFQRHVHTVYSGFPFFIHSCD